MNSERWEIAVHEAGHAVAGIELGGVCSGLVLNVDGGVAHLTVPGSDHEAYATAAGPVAQELAADYPQPELKEPAKLGRTAPAAPGEDFWYALSVDLAEVPGSMRTMESDDRRLAVWAIGGYESDPERWARRIQFAKYIAHKIVQDNADKIIRVAEQLFIQGSLSGDDVSAILAASEKGQ